MQNSTQHFFQCRASHTNNNNNNNKIWGAEKLSVRWYESRIEKKVVAAAHSTLRLLSFYIPNNFGSTNISELLYTNIAYDRIWKHTSINILLSCARCVRERNFYYVFYKIFQLCVCVLVSVGVFFFEKRQRTAFKRYAEAHIAATKSI